MTARLAVPAVRDRSNNFTAVSNIMSPSTIHTGTHFIFFNRTGHP